MKLLKGFKVLGIGLFAFSLAVLFNSELSSAEPCVKGFSFKTANMTYSSLDVEKAKTDLIELQAFYQCIHDRAKVVKDPAATTAKQDYSVLIEDAIELNKLSVIIKKNLQFIVNQISTKQAPSSTTNTSFRGRANPTIAPSTQRDTADKAKLELIIKDLDKIAVNSQKIASAKFAEYQNANPNASQNLEIKEIIKGPERRIVSTTPEEESLLSKLIKEKEEADKLKEVLTGEYLEADKLNSFISDLERDQFVVKISEETPSSTTTTTSTTADAEAANKTTEDAPKTYTEEEIDKIVDEKIEAEKNSDLQKKLNDILLKKAIAPASSDSTTGSSGGGGGGLGTAKAPEAYNAQREKERAKWLERAKAAEEKAMRRAMLKELKTGRPAKPPRPSGKRAGAVSLRDLFQKGQKPGLKSPMNAKRPESGDQMLSFLDRRQGTTDPKDKYKSYYKMGTGPADLSPKDLFRTKFDSLYEKARIKALTEGADSEYAGRYIDIFLLVRSIMDDYYKSGKLADTKEIVKPVHIRK
jgi:hypothetical protein